MEQRTGLKLGKEYVKAVYCHPAYLTYVQSTSCKMPGWMNHKQESRLPGEISIISEHRWYLSNGESEEELKNLLMRVIEESEKAGLTLNIQKTKIMASSPIISCQIDGETMQTVTDFIFLGSKITADSDCSHEIKTKQNTCPLGGKLWQSRQHIKKKHRHHFDYKGLYSQSYGITQYSCMEVRVGPHIQISLTCSHPRKLWKKAEHWRTDAFELWCWGRLLKVPWTASLPWKWTEIIVLFLRLHPSTAFQTLLLTMRATPFLLRDSFPQ